MIISIHQPNYLPWTGLIHKIALSDLFVIFDDIQLVRGKSFVIRTKIKTSGGAKWITVPVKEKSHMIPINNAKINNETNWKEEHWDKIFENYKETAFFQQYSAIFKKTILHNWEKIVDLNIRLIIQILDILSIKTEIRKSSEFNLSSSGIEKIIDLIKAVDGNEFLAGMGEGTKRYVSNNEKLFDKNKINLRYQKFKSPTYKQLYGDFIPNLSVLDMIFNIGPDESIKKLNLN